MKTTRRKVLTTLAVTGGAMLVGCGSDADDALDAGSSDAGARDAAIPRDGAPHDPDAALSADAGDDDAGELDASTDADAGEAELDAGSEADAGEADAGTDAGSEPDAGSPAGFVLGTTKPTAANTGLNVSGVAESALTTVAGNVTHSTNDAVYEGIRFTGRVSITGKRITYRNCWFNGPHSSSQALVVCSNANCEALVFENCLFRPSSFGTAAAGALANCLFGHDFRLVRCDLSGGIDCIGLYSGSSTVPARNVEILGSYLHGMTFFSPDAGHSDNRTHNDAIQIHRGAQRMRVFGTHIDASLDPAVGQASTPPVTGAGGAHASGNPNYPSLTAMSGFMFSPVDATAGVSDIEIDRNWLSHGECHINWPRTDGVNVRITNNRWGTPTLLRDGAGNPSYILMRRVQIPSVTVTGNVIEATGEPYDRVANGG